MISIVSTLYKSEDFVTEFVDRCIHACKELSEDYEIVLVDDGSPDKSRQKALKEGSRVSNLTLIELSKNFGHHQAIMAGLKAATGDMVFLIDCDLEENPEWLIEFHKVMNRLGCDAVVGKQIKRKGGFLEKITGEIFYAVFNLLSDTKLEKNFTTARLMNRLYVDSILRFEEKSLFLGGIMEYAGFFQVTHPVAKRSRKGSSYSLIRRAALFVDAVTSFSPRPLYLIFWSGLLIALAGSVLATHVVVLAIKGSTMTGWASVIASIWMLGGAGIFSIGVVGTYIGKVLVESKARPGYIIKNIYNRCSSDKNTI